MRERVGDGLRLLAHPRVGRWVPAVTFVGLLAVLPLVFNTPYALSNLTLIGIYTLVTLGLCLLMGYAGQASLGQAGFLALGSYGSAVLTARYHLPPVVAAGVAAGVTAGVAWLVGIPILKLRGHYLAMGTLALGVVVNIGLREWRAITGGPSGLAGIPHLSLIGVSIRGDLPYYYAVWAVATAILLISLNIVDSRFGRSLRAIRASEAAAESVGVDVGRTKLLVFVLAAVYASLAGSLYAHYMTFISPSTFDIGASVRLVLMAAVGGLASIWGAPFGAATVVLLALVLREAADAFFPSVGGEYQSIAYGLLLVVIMIFMPEGVTVSGVQMVRRAFRQRRRLAFSYWRRRYLVLWHRRWGGRRGRRG
ncbi:MAG: branched-chain amino acid ABC transporter permease [Anaerolineae bacterium]|nr:branched-chain amino acid ABC transporter permease [Anaerolineae bacterium]